MGFSSSPKVLAGKTATMAAAAGATPGRATRVAAESAAAIIRSVSPNRLRNVGKGARLGVRVVTLGTGMRTIGIVKASGPWQIIEYDTRPHPIPRLKGSRGKKYGPAFGGQGKAIAFNGIVRRTVWHPGTKGQYPFHKGAALARPLTPKVYNLAITAEMAAIFR